MEIQRVDSIQDDALNQSVTLNQLAAMCSLKSSDNSGEFFLMEEDILDLRETSFSHSQHAHPELLQ